MSWALWLAVPVVLTVLAALITWARSRPGKAPNTREAVQQYSDYLDALARTPRGYAVPPADSSNQWEGSNQSNG